MILTPLKQIDAGNIKLAKFLGIKLLEDEGLVYPGIYDSIEKIKFLKFHESFDWLFVVVCRLEGLGYQVNISEGACVVMDEDGNSPVAWNTCKQEITPEELRLVLFNSCLETVDDYYSSWEENVLSSALLEPSEWAKEEDVDE